MDLKHRYLPVISLVVFLVFIMIMKIPLYSEVYSTITGKVIDEKTGKGVEGVEVTVFSEFSTRSIITNERGEFALYKVEHGELSIIFLPPPPYAKPLMSNIYEKCFLERGKNLFLEKKLKYGGCIEGRIYEVQWGFPIKADDVYHLEVERQVPPFCEIDKNGNFRIDQLPTGVCTMIVMVKGFGMREIKNVEIKENESTEVDIAFDLNSPTKITGKITCTDPGITFDNLMVNLRNEKLYTATYTDGDGNYIFNDILPGDYKVFITGINENEIEIEKQLNVFAKMITVFHEKPVIVNLTVDCGLDFTDF